MSGGKLNVAISPPAKASGFGRGFKSRARLPSIAIPREEVTVKLVPWTLLIIEREVS